MTLNRKFLPLLALFGLLFFSACDPNEDIYNALDQQDTGHKGSLEITLTSEDYSTIASLAKKSGNTKDSINANFISANNYFTDEATAADYVPAFLAKEYKAYGDGSNALVTFNYNGDIPENLDAYTNAATVALADSNYASVNFDVGFTKYFSPAYPAEIYMPSILKSIVTNPEAGQIVLASYQESDVTPVIDTAANVFFVDEFESALGEFSAYSVLGEQVWESAPYGEPKPCAKISGYSNKPIVNEDWLISPKLNFAEIQETAISLHFDEAIKYESVSVDSNQQVFISTKYSGSGAPSSKDEWKRLDVTGRSAGNSWSFVSVDDVSLSSYLNEGSVYIAFKYTSSETNAATWEIDNVTISSGTPITGKTPVTTQTYYRYEGGKWSRLDDAYYLNSYDYDRMGNPGDKGYFSTSNLPKDYLPNFMNYKFPGAGEGVSKVIGYRFYNSADKSTETLGTELIYKNGSWTLSYHYIASVTQQFLVKANRGNWLFDPTVTFEMSASDYQKIVDSRDKKYHNSYGTGEFYSGANAHYKNFDLRIAKRVEYDEDNFKDLSDSEAAKLIIQRLVDAMKVLLKKKYPNAVAQVSGVDVHFKVTFKTYNNDFSRSTWIADMQCTKDGPNPEFELVNNTFTRDGEAVLVE